MKFVTALFTAALFMVGVLLGQTPAPVSNLAQVKRIYVAPLTGGSGADSLRELIIAGLDGTKLFVLTDNPDRADAVLKGAAEDHAFEDTFDASDSISSREKGGQGGSGLSRAAGLSIDLSAAGGESRHIKERKHEAYAAVRLCNHDGDVLWSTTQESPRAKFRGAGADVAARIARQITLDVERLKRDNKP